MELGVSRQIKEQRLGVFEKRIFCNQEESSSKKGETLDIHIRHTQFVFITH
jgi:hypothetical protein